MSNDRLLSYIGLCKKAGKLICGTEMTAEAIRSGKIKLAVNSSDASANSVKRIKACAEYRSVSYIRLPCTSEQLGHAAGRSSDISSAGITDDSFAEMIKKAMENII